MARNVKKFKKVAGNQKIVGNFYGDFSRISRKKSLSKLEIAVLKFDYLLENLNLIELFQFCLFFKTFLSFVGSDLATQQMSRSTDLYERTKIEICGSFMMPK